MLVSTKFKPYPTIQTYCDTRCGGTPYFISIFGFVFMINLEEQPVLQHNQALIDDFPQEYKENYCFELISLT